MNQIGTSVRLLREKKGITQEELATAMGLQQAMISHIEHGRRDPSLKIARRLADYFGVTVDSLHSETPAQAEPA